MIFVKMMMRMRVKIEGYRGSIYGSNLKAEP